MQGNTVLVGGEYTTPAQYQTIRKKQIVDVIYQGRDNLPFENKENLLREYMQGEDSFHGTHLKKEGGVMGNNVSVELRVATLENCFLLERGLIDLPLC